MSGTMASLWRRGALVLLAGAALAYPMVAKADITDGLSVRVGVLMPQRSQESGNIGLRDITNFAVFGGGLEYKIPWFPQLLSGEHWSTSLSADVFYSERKTGILRYIPVAINQVYTFEEQGGASPYVGFSLIAATFGANGVPEYGYYPTSREGEYDTMRTPMVTRFGLGLVVGVNFPGRLYAEGRYEWIDKHSTPINPEGFRMMLGYRF